MKDDLLEPHKPQFESAPDQARKAATADDAYAAAAEMRPDIGTVRQQARARRAALAAYGKKALPPEQR